MPFMENLNLLPEVWESANDQILNLKGQWIVKHRFFLNCGKSIYANERLFWIHLNALVRKGNLPKWTTRNAKGLNMCLRNKRITHLWCENCKSDKPTKCELCIPVIRFLSKIANYKSPDITNFIDLNVESCPISEISKNIIFNRKPKLWMWPNTILKNRSGLESKFETQWNMMLIGDFVIFQDTQTSVGTVFHKFIWDQDQTKWKFGCGFHDFNIVPNTSVPHMPVYICCLHGSIAIKTITELRKYIKMPKMEDEIIKIDIMN